MTMRMPSMVRLVSAMGVASTTLRRPAAARRARRPAPLAADRRRAARSTRSRIAHRLRAGARPGGSRALPGRKTSRSPSVSSRERAADRRGDGVGRSRSGAADRDARHRPESCGPALVTMGASPSSRRHPRAVERGRHHQQAQIRRAGGAWLPAPAPGRDRRPGCARGIRRRCTRPTPSSAGSSCSMRVRMPSVTTSMRVCGPTSRVQPHAIADGLADRLAQQCAPCAAPRRAAASRRGSSMTMRRPRARARRAAPAAPAWSCRRPAGPAAPRRRRRQARRRAPARRRPPAAGSTRRRDRGAPWRCYSPSPRPRAGPRGDRGRHRRASLGVGRGLC